MSKLTEDQVLVRRLLTGEEAAFSRFFDEFFPRLYRFARTRVRNEEDVRDVVQETLTRAILKIETYRGEAALFTWLCQICRSRISEVARKHGRHAEHLVLAEDHPDVAASLESIRMPDADPHDHALRAETLRIVQVVLDALPVRYGNALQWKYLEGASVQTIAERLGVPQVAAQSLLQRARGAFRDAFESITGAAPEGLP